MRALLTGGAGFIGSHLARYLISRGYTVDCVDNLSTGTWESISDLAASGNLNFTLGSADDAALMEPLVENADVIFHMAASVGVQRIMTSVIESLENNIFGTSLMLRLADKHKRRVFIFSTSEVYGKSERLPFRESEDVTLGPVHKLRWSYAASKLVDDYLAIAYHAERQLPVTVVRLFNTIGVGQVGQYGMVVPRFFKQALSEQPITIYGDGTQTRCFTDVRDVVNVLFQLIPNERSYGELINIGNADEITILELARRIKEVTLSASTLNFISFEKAYGQYFEDMGRRLPSTEKLFSITGYRMKYSLSDTLQWIHEANQLSQALSGESNGVISDRPSPAPDHSISNS